ncbi:putative serine protease HtrA [Hyella patelloides LEGE 07179]|uniref:Putative serine protease HtrA n=1 Tax=Hyella patelloides LEGE 07179 TaxID=945734 RepID=A0A563VIS7_9CYAN|nr:HhoA/HhoB/HtrA family serine endopeptidase [Hyella patelloides]VEP11356.1 putative serine protease HtrA [Hyella patelloides LEGE 07179]
MEKKQSVIWNKATTSLSLVLLGGGLALGGNYLMSGSQSIAKDTTGITSTVENTSESEIAIAVPQNYVSDVVNQVGDSVVRIDASRTVSTNVPEMFNDPFSRKFFGSQMPNIPNERTRRGLGSGFVVSSDGLILTNAHVVDGSDRVTVTLKDGSTHEGKVMGTDSFTDLAVIKIEAEDLPAVNFADSEELQPGEWAIAIGNPLGLDNTVTTGIVSATGRSSAQVGVADKRISFIQTDAAINPGNSGGPLLNAQGEVIGINTAIIQNAQGIGFAIPINAARDVAEELIAKGKVDHSFLGIQMAQLSPEIKQQLKSQINLEVNVDEGVLIVDVVPNSPADRAGLRTGDIIQEIADRTITKSEEVQQAVAKTDVGEQLALGLQRDGRRIDTEVEIGVLPQPQEPNS